MVFTSACRVGGFHVNTMCLCGMSLSFPKLKNGYHIIKKINFLDKKV